MSSITTSNKPVSASTGFVYIKYFLLVIVWQSRWHT
jgi:hypothetical protein